jgi:hypothetical protein
MLAHLHNVLSFITNPTLELAAAFLAFFSAAVVAYARDQFREGTNWVLAPLTHILPWNAPTHSSPRHQPQLISDFSLVDVFLCDADGKFARYQKTTSYVVTGEEIASYQEGVTAEGYADAFRTMRGAIAETVKEHGFYISRIDFADTLTRGLRFTNVYAADLHDCFTKNEEHWTQELAFQTKHLTLQIHFPKERPPKFVQCKSIHGTTDKPLKTSAKIVDLFGQKSIVWEVDQPAMKQILKLEWLW